MTWQSALANILLDFNLLQSSMKKATTNICDIIYGSTGKLECSDDWGATWTMVTDGLVNEEKPAAALEKILETSTLIKPNSLLRLHWPSPLTENGIILTDSPGMNDSTARDQVVKNYANSSIGIILMVNAIYGVSNTVFTVMLVI